MIRQAVALFVFIPLGAAAEMHEQLASGFLVDDTRHCEQMVDVDLELHVWNVVSAGGATLGAFGTATEDVNCWFDEPIGFSWREPSTQLVLAACYLADRIEPTVFAIETVAEEPGLVTVWKQGVDAPTTFHVCEAPG